MKIGMTVGVTVQVGDHYAKVSVFAEDEDNDVHLSEATLVGKTDMVYGMLADVVMDKLDALIEDMTEEGYVKRRRRSSK